MRARVRGQRIGRRDGEQTGPRFHVEAVVVERLGEQRDVRASVAQCGLLLSASTEHVSHRKAAASYW